MSDKAQEAYNWVVSHAAAIHAKLAEASISDFTDLADVDTVYTGKAGKYVKVNATEDGLDYGLPDDTPVVGELVKPVSSNWAFDHDADVSAHHVKYTDAEAVSAMGALADDNPLNHDRYTDAEAVSAAQTVKLDDLTAPDNNTDLDASAATHGLLPKLDNNATHFLNGQGSWAAPASSSTKQFFVPIGYPFGGAWGGYGNYATYTLNSANDTVYYTFRMPNDFVSLTSAKISFIGVTTGTIDWTTTTDAGASGENYNTHSGSATVDGEAVTNNKLKEVDVTAAFHASVSANDLVGCLFTVDVFTSTTGLNILGLDVKYA